jgi:chemotaxis signal transduction protein
MPAPLSEIDRKPLRVILFSLSGTEYALIVDSIFEIIVRNSLSPVPRTRRFIRGAVAYKDRIIPVFDAAAILGHPPSLTPKEKHTILIVNSQGRFLGLEADRVLDIVETSSVTFRTVVARDLDTAIEGVGVLEGAPFRGKKVFFLLNVKKLIAADEPFDIKIQDIVQRKLEASA